MKTLRLISYAAISLIMAVSCGKKDPDIDPDHPSEPCTPEESKEIIEDAIVKLTDAIDSKDIEKINDYASTVSETISNSNTENLEEWISEALEKVQKYSEYYATKANVYEVSDFEATYSLSTISGHFELVGNEWKCSKADDLLLKFKDEKGKDCEISLVGSGKSSTIMIEDCFDSDEYDQDWDGDGIISEWEKGGYYNENGDYVKGCRDKEKISVVVPENIKLTAKYGSEKYVDVQLKTSFNVNGALNIEDYEINVPAVNSAVASISGDFNLLDYNLNLSEFSKNAGKGAFSATFKKGKELLASAKMDIDGFKVTDDVDNDVEINKMTVDFDVIGDVQVKGSLYSEAFKAETYDPRNEAQVREIADKISKAMDLGIYFGSNVKQASVKVAPYFDEGYWDYEPVLVFNDGTSYSFEEYFNENDFSELLDKLEELFEIFEDFS